MTPAHLSTLHRRYQRALARLMARRRFTAVNLLIVRWWGWVEAQTLPPIEERVYDAELAEGLR